MKKLFAVLFICMLIFVVVGCSKDEDVGKSTAEDLIGGLKGDGLPIGDVVVYTSENDPNEMLGRPNQYISKVNFEDTRLEQDSDGPVGGSIEVFNNSKDLNTRADYLKSVFEEMPVFTEYLYTNDNYLLRLNKGLSVGQAEEYLQAFEKLK